jgi:hypothetical protein
MERTERTLVILLTMHRSGSSLTTSIMRQLGMALGPFELERAHSSNPHGHFEAVPIFHLSRELQVLSHGFPDDLPVSEEGLRRFLTTRGAWDEQVQIPEDLLVRGRAIIESLLDSGRVVGFKDPRTVLLWHFWQRVLSAYPDVRVVPVLLMRSPHEIAMSLFTRSQAKYSYWSCLDVVAVHFDRLQTITREWSEPLPLVRFDPDHFLKDLEQTARHCNLDWDVSSAQGRIDLSCIHHSPTTVSHESQQLYESLCHGEVYTPEFSVNQTRLAQDERHRETQLRREIGHLQARLNESEQRSLEMQLRLDEELARSIATQTEFERARAVLHAMERRLRTATDQLNSTTDRLRSKEERLHGLEEDLRASRAQLDNAHEQINHLRRRIGQFEGHPILGPTIRGRRRLKRAIQSLRLRASI